MINIKALAICVLTSARCAVAPDTPVYEDVLACWKDQCRPSDHVQCQDPQVEPFFFPCLTSVVCCPTVGNAECNCFEENCPNGWDYVPEQYCSKCCNYCFCLPKDDECPANTFEKKNQLCGDDDEFMKECCKDGECFCLNGAVSDNGHSCPSGYADRGMCKSCCESPAGVISGWPA